MTEPRTDRRLCLALWGIGLAAILSLLAAPLERLQPPQLHFGRWQFRLLALVNPVLLTTLAVAAGCWAARRVGLDAPLVRALVERGAAGRVLRAQAGPALLGGIAAAAVLLVYDWWSAPLFAAAKPVDLAMPLAAKLLYGGVVEELMLRWGAMSVLVWLARRLRAGRAADAIGIALAALLFAAGHLPLLFALVPHPPAALVAGVVAGNALPGLAFGWLFRRRGLEAAMLAHALGHLLFTLAG